MKKNLKIILFILSFFILGTFSASAVDIVGSANVTINPWIISTSAGAGGTISPASFNINGPSFAVLEITPNSGYVIVSASGCGGSLSFNTYITGTITSDCTVSATFAPMTGTLTSGVSSCTIALGASTCTTNPTLTWGITNPIANPTSITASGMTNINVTTLLITPQSGTQSVVVPYGGRTFFLYNNAIELASVGVTSSCASGSWNGTICATVPTVTTPTSTAVSVASATLGANVTSLGFPASISARGVCYSSTVSVPTTPCVTAAGTTTGIYTVGVSALSPGTLYYYRGYATNSTGIGYSAVGTFTTTSSPTGSLTASACSIALNASTCNTNLVWSTTNPVDTSAVTTPTSITVATANASAGTAYAIDYNTARTFYLYNYGYLLAQATVAAPVCAAGAWNGTTCAQNTLTVTNNLAPGTSVTSSPVGISCGADCTQAYDYNTVVTVTAPAVAGYSVAISNGCTATGGIGIGASCSVTMNASKTVAVVYTVSTNTLTVVKAGTGTGTVTSSPVGISCGADCSQAYNYNTSVTLTAAPTSGSSLASWSGGGCSGAASTCVTTVTAATSVTATFNAMAGTLTSNFPSCTIALGASSCNVNLTWTVANPIGATTEITASGMTNYVSPLVTGGGPTAFAVPYSTRTFYLYNNAITFANVTVTSSCASGAWNGTACAIIPTVTTPTVTAIGQSQATLGANVTSLGYPTTISRGTCWGTSPSPTTNCTAQGGTTTGVFTHVRTGMTPSTLYYYRGYATNTTGTAYSADGSFTTSGVTISVVASPVTYNVLPSAALSFAYTPTTNSGTTQCKLLDSTKTVDIKPYQAASPLTTTASATPGAYGYYVRCQNVSFPTYTADSALITANVIAVNVTASPTTYNVAPGASVSFAYTSGTTPAVGAAQCQLLNNVSAALTAYQPASPIVYAVPNSVGTFTYYVKCQNTTLTTAVVTSGLITVNTSCSAGTTFNGTTCVLPTGTLTASNCNIPASTMAAPVDTCNTNLVWTTTNPIGTSSVTTDPGVTVATANSSSTTYPVLFGTRDFYLYNNANELATAMAQAVCTAGTVWNGTICTPPTGSISANGCTIALNASGCNTTLDWTTTNPLNGFISIVKNTTDNVNVETTLNTGTKLYSLTPVNKTFALIHNGVTLASVSPLAVCAITTHWNGTTCVIDAPDDAPGGNTIFTVNEESTTATIFKGRTATIVWNSSVATSCSLTSSATAFEPAATLSATATSGSIEVSPLDTTTYTLTCVNASSPGGTSFPITTKVITLEIKES